MAGRGEARVNSDVATDRDIGKRIGLVEMPPAGCNQVLG